MVVSSPNPARTMRKTPKKAPRSPAKPSKPVEAPRAAQISPLACGAVDGNYKCTLIAGHTGEHQVWWYDGCEHEWSEAPIIPHVIGESFQARWEALTTREKNLVRFAADQKGVTLATLLEKFPQYRHQG